MFILYNFVLWPTTAQLFHKLSHSHMFRHCRVILGEFVVSSLLTYTSMSHAAVGNTIYNYDISQQLHLKYACNLASYKLLTP